MKTNLIKAIYLTFGLSSLALTGCSDSWLKPEPLSFYEPSVTLSTKEGLEAALTTCHRQMRYYYMEDNGPALATEMIFSDVAVTAVPTFQRVPGHPFECDSYFREQLVRYEYD